MKEKSQPFIIWAILSVLVPVTILTIIRYFPLEYVLRAAWFLDTTLGLGALTRAIIFLFFTPTMLGFGCAYDLILARRVFYSLAKVPASKRIIIFIITCVRTIAALGNIVYFAWWFTGKI
jgi:hypothetical protein